MNDIQSNFAILREIVLIKVISWTVSVVHVKYFLDANLLHLCLYLVQSHLERIRATHFLGNQMTPRDRYVIHTT